MARWEIVKPPKVDGSAGSTSAESPDAAASGPATEQVPPRGPERWRAGDDGRAADTGLRVPTAHGCHDAAGWERIALSRYDAPTGVPGPVGAAQPVQAEDGKVVMTCGNCKGAGTDWRSGGACVGCSGKGTVALRPPVIKCAYCRGRGQTPSKQGLSCTVCGGKGWVSIREPAVRCAYCGGSGTDMSSKFPCTVCKGTGMVHVKQPAATCDACRATGRDRKYSKLNCAVCKGVGVVTVRSSYR